MKSVLLLHTYQLCVEEDVVRLREENPQAAGAVLSGNVIGVARDRVQLHLDIDGEHAPA